MMLGSFFCKIGFFQLAGNDKVEIIIKSMKTILSYLTILSTILATTYAGDWPSWRGPARDDISMEKGLLKNWPSEVRRKNG